MIGFSNPNVGFTLPDIKIRWYNRRVDGLDSLAGDVLCWAPGTSAAGITNLLENDPNGIWSCGVKPGEAGSPPGLQAYGVYAICTEDIAIGQRGYVQVQGYVRRCRVGSSGDTLAVAKGDDLFARPSRVSMSASTASMVGSKVIAVALTAQVTAATALDYVETAFSGVYGWGTVV